MDKKFLDNTLKLSFVLSTFFGLLALLVTGCADPKPIDQNGIVQSAPIDNSTGYSEKSSINSSETSSVWSDSLRKYFTETQIIKIEEAAQEFNRIKNASDLEKFYSVTLDSVIDIVNTQIQISNPTEFSGDASADLHWKWFKEYFPLIVCNVLCSECDYEAMINLTPLRAKAKQTPEYGDDLFFEMAMAVYQSDALEDVVYDGRGESIGNSGWYALVGCDMCNASTVGDNQHLNILLQVDEAVSVSSLFKETIEKYKENALNVEDDHYYYEKLRVLAELVDIKNSGVLNEKEVKLLQESIDRIKTNSNIQFNCGNGNCTWSQD